MTGYIIAPNGRWSGRDPVGNAIANGQLFTYRAGTNTFKATFQDAAGLHPHPNPIILDAKGEASIFWADDAYYDIELYTSGGRVSGQLVYGAGLYPHVASTNSSPITVINSASNEIRNPQFTYATNSSSYTSIQQSVNDTDYVLDDWAFFRSNLESTININQRRFTLGQTSVPGNPAFYLEYQCTNTGAAGETYKRFSQVFYGASTFSNQNLQFALQGKAASTGTPITVSIIQHFGTGGTPSADVETVMQTSNLTTAWNRYISATIVPSVTGKVLGTNNDDCVYICINLPLNQTATVDITNVQMNQADVLPAFPLTSKELQYLHTQKNISQAVWLTGDVKSTISIVADPGWIMMDDGTIGSPASGSSHIGLYLKNLFIKLWNNTASVPTNLPIFTSNGLLTTRGTSAEADFNANKRLSLPRSFDRTIINANNLGTQTPIAQIGGQNDLTLSLNQMPPHEHSPHFDSASGNNFVFNVFGDSPETNLGQMAASGSNTFGRLPPNSWLKVVDDIVGGNTDGSTAPIDMRQASVYLNFMIKT